MKYKQLILKRGNTPIVTTDLSYATVNIKVYEKADIEIWDEKGKSVINFSMYPGQDLMVSRTAFKFDNAPEES